MRGLRLAICCALLGSGLAGCASHRDLLASSLNPQASRAVELADTPFFPQQDLQCGPAALATVLTASGAHATPDELAPFVFLPERQGSLQLEMLAAPRTYARLSYPLEGNLADLTAELAAGRPVLVFHNYGLPMWPRWHYAVAVGYDADGEKILLRSGKTHRQVLSAATFMRAWDNGGRWAMVVLRPGEMPATADRARYLESAAAFERVAIPQDTEKVFNAAVTRWPDEPIAWIGRGSASYRIGNLQAAAADYAAALRIDPLNPGARNNLAMTLLGLGCPQVARAQIGKIPVDSLQGALREAALDTRSKIEARRLNVDAPLCGALPAP